jgi:hypothetical protein
VCVRALLSNGPTIWHAQSVIVPDVQLALLAVGWLHWCADHFATLKIDPQSDRFICNRLAPARVVIQLAMLAVACMSSLTSGTKTFWLRAIRSPNFNFTDECSETNPDLRSMTFFTSTHPNESPSNRHLSSAKIQARLISRIRQ